MTQVATIYHAGCPVCVDAVDLFAEALDPKKYAVEIVHLGASPDRIAGAEAAGVKSVPAFVVDGQAFHINFGAHLDDLKGGA